MRTDVDGVEVVATSLTRCYGSRRVVDDVSLTAPAGSVTAILGSNGAGKSTTFRLMLGFTIGAGRTTFAGRELRDVADPAATVGAFLGAPAFSLARTARDHLRIVGTLSGQRRSRVDEVLELVGLAPWASCRPAGFSTGMRQRLGMAAAILADPAVLVLDEPVNGLDPEAVIAMRELIRGHARRGGTVLMASHLLTEVELVADHVVIMSAGRVVRHGSVAHLLEREDRAVVMVECDDPGRLSALAVHAGGAVSRATSTGLVVTGVDARRLAVLAHGAGVLIWRLQPRPRTLEDAFLAAVGQEVDPDTGPPAALAVAAGCGPVQASGQELHHAAS